MKQLEMLAGQRAGAKRRYETALKQQNEVEAELREIRRQRDVAESRGEIDKQLELSEQEVRQNKRLQLLVFATKRELMLYAGVDGQYNELRHHILGLYSSVARYEQIVIPGIEQRIEQLRQEIRDLEAQIKFQQDQKQQKLFNEIRNLTDMTKTELQQDDPIDPQIGHFSKRGVIIARM